MVRFLNKKHVGWLTILLMIWCAESANAQQLFEMDVWSNGAPNSNGLSGPEVINPRTKGSDNVSNATITLYLPQSESPVPAVVICPGGGYVSVNVQRWGHGFAQWLVS